MSDIATEASPAIIVTTSKSLREQREDLCAQLQLNRRLLAYKLTGKAEENHFPRSVTMRFLSRQSTHQMIKKVAGAALGIQTFKALHYGYSLMHFVRRTFSKQKNFF